MSVPRLFLAAVASVALLAGCAGSEPRDGDPLLVMAAASLDAALPVLIDSFSVQSGTQVDVVLGSTGNLASQIEHGAPADLFFAADRSTVERLEADGLLRDSTVHTYAVGRVALVWRSGIEPPTDLQAIIDEAN